MRGAFERGDPILQIGWPVNRHQAIAEGAKRRRCSPGVLGMAVVEEAQSVLDVLDELERENDAIVRLLGQDDGAEPKGDSEEKEPA